MFCGPRITEIMSRVPHDEFTTNLNWHMLLATCKRDGAASIVTGTCNLKKLNRRHLEYKRVNCIALGPLERIWLLDDAASIPLAARTNYCVDIPRVTCGWKTCKRL